MWFWGFDYFEKKIILKKSNRNYKKEVVFRNHGVSERVLLNKKEVFLVKKIVFFVFVLFFIMGCGEEKGKLRIWLTDAPPPQDVEHIYLTVLGVGIRDEEGDATTIQSDIHTIDVVRLIGGYAVSLTYSYRGYFVDVEPGDYTSVLLALALINSVVRDGVEDSLLVTGDIISYELEEDFTILPGEYLTIVVDFDASESIDWESRPYELTPHFRIFQSSTAGFVRGKVKTVEDSLEVSVKFATVQAVCSTDVMTTLSDTAGNYSLFIPEGTYDLNVSAEGYTASDTTYGGLEVIRDSVLDGYNFMLE
jgi:hypothetical protein